MFRYCLTNFILKLKSIFLMAPFTVGEVNRSPNVGDCIKDTLFFVIKMTCVCRWEYIGTCC